MVLPSKWEGMPIVIYEAIENGVIPIISNQIRVPNFLKKYVITLDISDFESSLKLMKKIEDNDSIRAYQNKLAKKNTELKDALEEIQKMREQAVRDLITDSMEITTDPTDLVKKGIKNMTKFGKQVAEETKIMTKVFNP